MIIVGINGGLGNQMFQYALYLKLKELGKEVYVDDEILVNKLNDNGALKIFDVFDLDYKLCNKNDREKLADVSIANISRLRRKIFGKRNDEATCFREKDLNDNYYPELFDIDNKYLSGCWQSEKYFVDIKNVIYSNYTFDIDNSEADLKALKNQISQNNAVSIHIRRGDYVGNRLYNGICTEQYYEKAIDYIKSHVDNPVFYVFSDDIQYIKNHYRGKEFVIVEGFYGYKSHYDLYLMTCCKHNIVANSSFSWWGAWLNQNEEKIVICPKNWSNIVEFRHTPCDSWVKI